MIPPTISLLDIKTKKSVIRSYTIDHPKKKGFIEKKNIAINDIQFKAR